MRFLFSPFRNIINVKVPPGKGCGFIKYKRRIDAEAAMKGINHFIIGSNQARLSWGHSRNQNHTNSSGPVESNLQRVQLFQDVLKPFSQTQLQIPSTQID